MESMKRVRAGWMMLVMTGWLVVGVPAIVPAQDQNSSEPEADSGQPWLKGRLTIYVNGAMQISSEKLIDQFEYRAYGEAARFESSHVISDAPMGDVGGSLRLWRELSVGGSYAHIETTDGTTLTGHVPHPLEANNPRVITPQSLSFIHRAQVGHAFGAWRIPVVDKLDVSVFGGASFFNVTQGVVTNVTVAEAGGPPFTAVDVEQVQRGKHRRNGVGGHAGVDVTYLLTTSVGVGLLVRYSNGLVRLPSAGSRTLSLTVGGLELGGGVRFRF